MKQVLTKALSVLCLTALCLCFPFQAARAQPQSSYIRLHILAQSDSLHDQAVKLLIRDGIREYTASLLKEASDADDAWDILQAHENELLKIARASAEKYGYFGNVSLELGVFDFPDRIYGEEFVPAGAYRAVRIMLGEAKGRNWWCVVYPSLCLPEDADIDKPVEFYSSILRWLNHMWEVIAA